MATSNKMRALNRLPYDFVDGLKVKGVDIGTTTLEPVITDLNTTTTDNNVTVTSSTGADAVIPAATSTTAGVMSAADKVKLSGINLTAKQDTLVSGTNIKTINTNSLLGSGNVSVQPTLVSGTNIKTINGTSLLGAGNISVSGSVVSKIKIAIIGASLEAQANLSQETWPTKLQRALTAFGQDYVVYNLAVNGYTFGNALWTNTFVNYSATVTPVDMAISLGVDVVIVSLGADDTLTSDITPVQDVKDNALALFTALKTGLPNAKIIYASLLAFNKTHRPEGTECLNRDIVNYGMNLRTSGFLEGCYSSLILDDHISSNMSQRLQNWIQVDDYVKSLTSVDGWFQFDLYKCARLGLVGEDTVNLTGEGANMFYSWALKAFNNVVALKDVAPMIRPTNYPGFDDADEVFSLFCYDNGFMWIDVDQSTIANHISTKALMLRGIRPSAWAYPSKAGFFTGLDTIDKNGIAVWGVENAKPNTVVEWSVDTAPWVNLPFNTTAHGTVIVAQSHGHILNGQHYYYVKIGNEVFGPYLINKVNDGETG